MKKKVLSIALAGVMALGLFGCGSSAGGDSASGSGEAAGSSSDVKVGAGAVVHTDVPDGSTVVPGAARILKKERGA